MIKYFQEFFLRPLPRGGCVWGGYKEHLSIPHLGEPLSKHTTKNVLSGAVP